MKEGLKTKDADEDEGVEMCDSEEASNDNEFTAESDENEYTRIDWVVSKMETKLLDWNDMIEEYEAAEMAKLTEANNVLNDDALSDVGQPTIFSQFRRWVAKRLRIFTVCCSGAQGHGRSVNHLSQAM